MSSAEPSSPWGRRLTQLWWEDAERSSRAFRAESAAPASLPTYAMCEDYDYLGSRSDGGFAEYCLVPSDWHFVPTENPAATGEMLAMTEPCTVAQHAIRKGGVCAGKSVRIFGAGPITFGTVVMMGNPHRDTTIRLAQNSMILRKELTLQGIWNSHYAAKPINEWQFTVKVMDEDRMRVDDLATHRSNLDRLPQLCSDIYAQRVSICKALYSAEEDVGDEMEMPVGPGDMVVIGSYSGESKLL